MSVPDEIFAMTQTANILFCQAMPLGMRANARFALSSRARPLIWDGAAEPNSRFLLLAQLVQRGGKRGVDCLFSFGSIQACNKRKMGVRAQMWPKASRKR